MKNPIPTPAEISARFPDLHPAFDRQAAIPEANRCLFCFDAPCMQACPTHIDVPRFIRKIASGNLRGSAQTILDANVMGASCSRACPVEVLCEGACVLHRYNREPIRIGRLQRYAMDTFHAGGPDGPGTDLPFTPAPDTGKTIALIGAGPASLACAAELRRHGHRATIYDARPLPGGLNTYGIAEYKLTLAASLNEIDMIRRLGVQFEENTEIDAAKLASLVSQHDAVFLGVGLGAIHRLGIAGEADAMGKLNPGVTDALSLVAGYKDGTITSVPPRVCVIGAGNTAIDAAIAAVRLGADEVTMIYRRGPEQMSAFSFEYDHAKLEGVQFFWHTAPVSIGVASSGLMGHDQVQSLTLIQLEGGEDGSLVPRPGSEYRVPVELVVLAIGQSTHTGFLADTDLKLDRGRIVIDRQTGQTTHPRFFAGGDCTNGGREVVDAVADGKRAALGIVAMLNLTSGWS
jgi:dihydropyrimidine dehydrogenase (NAD+) subunit PreT